MQKDFINVYYRYNSNPVRTVSMPVMRVKCTEEEFEELRTNLPDGTIYENNDWTAGGQRFLNYFSMRDWSDVTYDLKYFFVFNASNQNKIPQWSLDSINVWRNFGVDVSTDYEITPSTGTIAKPTTDISLDSAFTTDMIATATDITNYHVGTMYKNHAERCEVHIPVFYCSPTKLLHFSLQSVKTSGNPWFNLMKAGGRGITGQVHDIVYGASPIVFDGLDVNEYPTGSCTYTVETEGTQDTVTITINDGYVLNSVALYDPQQRLVTRWKELPANNQLVIRRDQPGFWELRITCNEEASPYNPTVPIEDLPTDTITPTYPTDYIGKYIGAGFYKLFIPTVTQLNAFVNYLYTQTFIDAIMQLWNKMLGIEEMIVGVNIIPGAPTVAGTAIPKVGWVSMTESQAMNYTVQQYLEINLGSMDVTRAWDNYLDFAPYTKISIYLPFIGERALDTNDVMGKTLNVRYHIDLLSGNCVAYVYVNGSIHYQFSGNCAYSIPISSADTANLFLQPLKAIAGLTLAGVGVATGNPMAVAAGHALGATVGSDESGAFVSPPSAEISAPDVRKVDGLNANTGYMGTIRPYLSIERVKPDINSGFGQEIGYQSNKFRTLGTLAGFTKVSEVHLEGISATTAELTQIEAMLKEGVII